ncbi:MAG: hypothetical protein RLZZ500_1561 [Bacteroidota bacterium]|jgi:glycosyltransferase involved in cell wall biosynthesis
MMRIAQIIDSLEIGGAEKMAVNYANAMVKEASFSALITTRKEGPLKQQIHPDVAYYAMNRKSKIDIRAVWKLRNFCKKHKINYVQAHSSSFFTAFLLKLVRPSIQIIWHDHNGLSEFISKQKTRVLQFCSFFFKGIVVVNYKLKNWAEGTLHCKSVIYLPNFTLLDTAVLSQTQLKGNKGKRIVCLANLRFQKNHFLLLDVAAKLKESHPDWSFHLVGKDFQDEYSREVNASWKEKQLNDTVFFYGTCQDIAAVLAQSDIAIITSQSEGLPVALLEFGLSRLPVVSTEVGEIPLILSEGKNGLLVPNYDQESFYTKLVQLIDSPELRTTLGTGLYATIDEKHSEKAIVQQFLKWVESL